MFKHFILPTLLALFLAAAAGIALAEIWGRMTPALAARVDYRLTAQEARPKGLVMFRWACPLPLALQVLEGLKRDMEAPMALLAENISAMICHYRASGVIAPIYALHESGPAVDASGRPMVLVRVSAGSDTTPPQWTVAWPGVNAKLEEEEEGAGH